MSDDPFVTLLVEALNLLHPRFAAAGGLAYAPDDTELIGVVEDRERPFLMEFYHQLRRLWDKALPVRLGLGHVMLQHDPAVRDGPTPDLLFWQLGEHGQPDRRLGAVSVMFLSNPAVLAADLMALAEARTVPGYPHAVAVVAGREADIPEKGLPSADGVTVIFFDTDRWTAIPASGPA